MPLPLPPLPASWSRLRALAGLMASAALMGCADLRPPPEAAPLLRDELFAPSPVDTSPARVMAMSEAMQRYAEAELRDRIGRRDARSVLLDALREPGRLQLSYDASRTGNAAETFEARSGNCLALVLMTGAFARHLGVEVSFRVVTLEPQYTRTGGLMVESGHVNLLMAQRENRPLWGAADLVVDFLPVPETAMQRVDPVEENTVLAMYMNNRAAETLAEGRVDDAYAWARAALRQDPRYATTANTLAVIYLRRGAPEAAERALRYALATNARNTAALGNLVTLLRSTGRDAEAEQQAALLRRLQPDPPFLHFDLGRQALHEGDARRALALFDRELRRQPHQHEVHFWAAQAAWRLGDAPAAAEHLRQARDFSPTVANQRLYDAKLEHLRTLQGP